VRDALRSADELMGWVPLPEPSETSEIPNHTLNPGARLYAGHTGSEWDAPAKTLKAGFHGVPGGENMLRLEDGTVRYFTVREAARLQSFPDDYVPQGSWCEAFRQLGNSVPVTLARCVAGVVAETLSSRAAAVIAVGNPQAAIVK
jgi:DNA (cytosine-5)-methyltransferase 1